MSKNPRVSVEQRRQMLEFMLHHPDLARGRVVGVDAARRKLLMLDELADLLNSAGGGASKSAEKWWKSWQDWRSDVKSKALKIKKCRAGTGGGPAPAPLSELESTLLQFCGVEMVEGVSNVADPLELEIIEVRADAASTSIEGSPDGGPSIEVTVEEVIENPPSIEGGNKPAKKNKQDPLEASLERQAVAMERVADGMERAADGLQSLSRACESISDALCKIASALAIRE